MNPRLFIIIIAAGLLFVSMPAYAYIGPAIAFISYLLGPVVAIFVTIGMILFLPLRKFLKKRKQQKQDEKTGPAAADDDNSENPA